jgi:hypothetical protein
VTFRDKNPHLGPLLSSLFAHKAVITAYVTNHLP